MTSSASFQRATIVLRPARHSRAATKNAKADGQMKSPEKRPHLPVMFTAWPDR
jgi:hypothetical protein